MNKQNGCNSTSGEITSNDINSATSDSVGADAIKIVTTESDGSNNTFYLRDFED